MNKHHNEWQHSQLHEVTPICMSITTSLWMNWFHSQHSFTQQTTSKASSCWAEAPIKIARMTLTIKLDGNWSSFQLANSAPPLSVTDSAIAPSARMVQNMKKTLVNFEQSSCVWLCNQTKQWKKYVNIIFLAISKLRICWGPRPPQKFRKSHWCVPFTATFSKRRKIGALWSERCDVLNC